MLTITWTEAFRWRFKVDGVNWRNFQVTIFGFDIVLLTSTAIANDWIAATNAGLNRVSTKLA